MTLRLDVQVNDHSCRLPATQDLRHWAESALNAAGCSANEMTIRITDEQESAIETLAHQVFEEMDRLEQEK